MPSTEAETLDDIDAMEGWDGWCETCDEGWLKFEMCNHTSFPADACIYCCEFCREETAAA